MATPINAIRPQTLDGIKRLAKAIKRERGVQHAEALNSAAIQAGYLSFKHAQNHFATAG